MQENSNKARSRRHFICGKSDEDVKKLDDRYLRNNKNGKECCGGAFAFGFLNFSFLYA